MFASTQVSTLPSTLNDQSKTPAILVPHSGGIYALQTNNEAQKYLILAYSSTPQIAARGNKLTLRIPPEFTSYIPSFIKHAMGKYGKNLALADADHDYAKAWNAAFKPAWEAAGGKIVADNPMSYNRATDFYSGVSRALAGKPDVLFIGGASEPTGLVVKQARELGFKGGFILIDQAKMDEVQKVSGGYASLEGSIGVLPLVDDSTADAKAFVERFRKVYPGRDPSSEVSLNYTAVHATAVAMKLAGSVTDAARRDCRSRRCSRWPRCSVTDATLIRAQLDKAYKTLAPLLNPNSIDGVDARGGSTADTRVAVVENGKIREIKLSAIK